MLNPWNEWAMLSEEEKYAEWSDYYIRFSGLLPNCKTYEQYCDRWEKTDA